MSQWHLKEIDKEGHGANGIFTDDELFKFVVEEVMAGRLRYGPIKEAAGKQFLSTACIIVKHNKSHVPDRERLIIDAPPAEPRTELEQWWDECPYNLRDLTEPLKQWLRRMPK